MSYNGVGLQTPRGSGTSGYVQKNVVTKRLEGFREKRARDEAETLRRETKQKMEEARRSAGKEVKEHLDKRRIEVECMELRDTLEDKDVAEIEIEKQVQALRKKLLAEAEVKEKVKIEKESSSKEDGALHFHGMSRRELVESQDREKTTANQKEKVVTHEAATEKVPKHEKETSKEKTGCDSTREKEPEGLALGSPFKYVPRYKSR